jgi:hypothetical protein
LQFSLQAGSPETFGIHPRIWQAFENSAQENNELNKGISACYIRRNFMIYGTRQVLVGPRNAEGHAARTGAKMMHTNNYDGGNRVESGRMHDREVKGRIILRWIVGRQAVRMRCG